MAEPCDCLNECGDDERVGLYQVEPCQGALNYAKRKLAELQAEVALREDAVRYRGVRRVANAQGYTDVQFDAQTDERVAQFDATMSKGGRSNG